MTTLLMHRNEIAIDSRLVYAVDPGSPTGYMEKAEGRKYIKRRDII